MAAYETVRAAMVRAGDVTPAGTVESVELIGGIRRVELVIGGRRFSRSFDDPIDRSA